MKSPIFLLLLDASLAEKVIILAASAHRMEREVEKVEICARVLESDEGEM